MKKTTLKKYARLAVVTGAAVQKGQPVIVYSEVDQSEFTLMVVDEAYKAGASKVRVEWLSQPLTKLHYRHQSLKNLSTVVAWVEEREKEFCKELPAVIHILSEDPDGLKGVNKEKMQKVRQNRYKVLKKYRDESDNKYQWSLFAVPSKEWAKKVFPNDRTSVAVSKLWDAILNSVHITEDNDPVEAWNEHNKEFAKKCAYLNNKKFDYLEYKSSNGTDFKCWLIPEGKWLGGGEKTLSGVYFNPNMPTEEIFTSPMKGKCEGRLVSTKPLSYQGQLIENFYIDFKDGKAVSWDAESGKDTLEKIITADESSGILGELALVPNDSPISNSGILFYNTLFDENASCHVALGAGFTNTIDGYEKLTKEECHKLGINESMVHVDFMIGSPDMSITGYKDGKATPIFKNGNWAI
ncbi:MAG: peptidase M29 [Clostridiales bacterium GWF2_36_10]|nr:MAG: peptidase M29 [Clostridiales bacterium GWF2_36_10]HAN21114.1 peptidase M29 [Clostridiales bacterium]